MQGHKDSYICNLRGKFLPVGTNCKTTETTFIPLSVMYLPAGMFCTLDGYDFYTHWCNPFTCKNVLYTGCYTYFHAIFNLHREFLYVGMFCIPMSMISLPASNPGK